MKKPYFEVHNYDKKDTPVNYLSCGCWDYYQPCFHWHSSIEVLYFYKGAGEVTIDGIVYTIAPGDIYVINQNQLHSFHGTPFMEYHCILIDENFLIQNAVDVANIQFETLIRSEKVRELYLNIVDELNASLDYSAAGVRSETLRFITHIARYYSVATGAYISSPNTSLQHALNYINAHFVEKINIEDIVEEINLSRYHFFRIFKQAVGMTPMQYINTMRCNKAKQLLNKKKYSINEIAVECGFENASYFSKTFKKYTGMLPSDYSKHHDSLK